MGGVELGKRRIRECAYCGELREITDDHVIPECLFEHPYPPNLITVPACDDCNGAKSPCDTFLRDWLTIDYYGSQSPDAQRKFQDKTLRAVQKGHSKLAKQFIREAQVRSVVTKSGRDLGNLAVLSLQDEQVEIVMAPIVRGLYYHENKVRMPDDLSFDFYRYRPEEFKTVWALFQKFDAPPLRKLGDVFGYTSIQLKEPEFATYWLLVFYGRAIFTVWAAYPEVEPQLA